MTSLRANYLQILCIIIFSVVIEQADILAVFRHFDTIAVIWTVIVFIDSGAMYIHNDVDICKFLAKLSRLIASHTAI